MPWPNAVYTKPDGLSYRVCRACGQEKLVDEFYKYRTGNPKSRCKACAIGNRVRLGRTTKTALNQRRCNLKMKFGLALSDYEEMLAAQRGACAICGSTNCGRKDYQSFAVDHDHQTGQIRGLLCSRCNTALGTFGTVALLLKAARYLEAGRRSSRYIPQKRTKRFAS